MRDASRYTESQGKDVSMDVDVRGRVRNTKLAPSNCLLPLFEAVVNSIDAIEEGGGGAINVHVLRDASQRSLEGGEGRIVSQPVIGFAVEDDGVGFTDENYASFGTSDSIKKNSKGGKGVGRLMWLKAFERAEITSVYKKGKKFLERSFCFTLSKGGIEDLTERPSEAVVRKTTVRLLRYRPGFKEKCPKSAATIARRIIEHCLEYFVLDTCPDIRLHDEGGDPDLIDLKDFFRSEVCVESGAIVLEIKGQAFQVHNVRISSGQDYQHRLHFCAHKRSVVSENLAARVPNLQQTIRDDDGKPFMYAGYMSGDFLDKRVDSERTSFDVMADTTGSFMPKEISWEDLTAAAVGQAQTFLSTWLGPIREAKEAKIREFVETHAPQYRPLLKHKRESLEGIPPNLPPDRLDVELYKIDQTYDSELREQGRKILAEEGAAACDVEEHERRFRRFIEEWNEAGMSKLARHVAYRKATLGFLSERLKLQRDGGYALEDSVHKIIFPMRTTSDDIRSDQMNLWIIDERLAYHHYLASDKPLKKVAPVGVDSGGRPDIIVFNRPFAFTESGPPFGSIVLVEFKRPARDDYTDEENPITQVYRYAREIRAGNCKDREGRPMPVPPNIPIYAYIVCDIFASLREQAENAHLTAMPDAQGYVGFNSSPNVGVYMEIISFDKMLNDSKRRNAVLFDKLGIPNWNPTAAGRALDDLGRTE